MTPAAQLGTFMAKYTPDIARQGRGALAKLRKLMPNATQLVYDNYNFLVIAFGPSERSSEAVLSLVFAPKWLSICFIYGKGMPDPAKLLRGGGNQVRTLRLTSPKDLDAPAVRALIKTAVSRMSVPFDPNARGKLVIRSISAKQRPRRPG